MGEASIKKRDDFEQTVRKEESALVKRVFPVLAGCLQKISKREIIGLSGMIYTTYRIPAI